MSPDQIKKPREAKVSRGFFYWMGCNFCTTPVDRLALFSWESDAVTNRSAAERLVFGSGRLPLWLRLPCAAFSLVWFLVAADTIGRHAFGVAVCPGQVRENAPAWVIVVLTVAGGLGFVSVWFMEVQIYVDDKSREIVSRYWGGRSAMRVDAAGAAGLDVRSSRGFPATRRWNLQFSYADGRRPREVFEFPRRDDALDVARQIGEALRLPVVER